MNPELEMIDNAVERVMEEVEQAIDGLVDTDDVEATVRKQLTAMYLNGITFAKTQEVK